jgi:hypothetical protein
MSKNQLLNRAHQKAWYDRIRNDPQRWRAYLEKKRLYKRNTREGLVGPKSGLGVKRPRPDLSKQEGQELFDEWAAIMHCDGAADKSEAERIALDWVLRNFTCPVAPRLIEHLPPPSGEVPF